MNYYKELGQQAFNKGLSRVPFFNAEIRKAIEQGEDTVKISRAFINGWDEANVAAVLEAK